MIHRNRRAELFERLNVQIDRPRADGAAAGQGNARVAEARDERAERQNRGAHRFHQFVGRFGVRNGFGLNGEFAGRNVRAFHAAAHVREKLGHGDDVAHVRNIFESDGFAGEQRRGHRRQRGIFRAADSDCAFELASALNFESIHRLVPGFPGALGFRLRARAFRAPWRTLPPACRKRCRASPALTPVFSITAPPADRVPPDAERVPQQTQFTPAASSRIRAPRRRNF